MRTAKSSIRNLFYYQTRKGYAAFTIVEILATLLVSSILLLFVLASYELLIKRFERASIESSEEIEILLLKERVLKVFNSNAVFIKSYDKLILKNIFLKNFETSIVFSNNGIIFEQGNVIDTIQLDTVNSSFYYKDSPVLTEGLVDHIKLKIRKGKSEDIIEYRVLMDAYSKIE